MPSLLKTVVIYVFHFVTLGTCQHVSSAVDYSLGSGLYSSMAPCWLVQEQLPV
jgi:hypothetical protein